MILSLSDLQNLEGRGKYGSFLYDITTFYFKYHRHAPGHQFRVCTET